MGIMYADPACQCAAMINKKMYHMATQAANKHYLPVLLEIIEPWQAVTLWGHLTGWQGTLFKLQANPAAIHLGQLYSHSTWDKG